MVTDECYGAWWLLMSVTGLGGLNVLYRAGWLLMSVTGLGGY